LLVYGADGLADWEIVELILQSSMTRRDTTILAKSLIAKFGSLGGVLSANVYELDAVAGIGRREVANLKAIQAVAVRLIKAKMQDGPLLQDWDRLQNYLTSVLSHETVEQLRVLFLNGKNALLGEELHSRGTVDHVPVYPREIVKRALELNASAVILAHNHPSGNPTPSAADVQMTVKIMSALQAVDIVLHDHIIVGTGTMASFRRLGVLPFAHIDPDVPYHRKHKMASSKRRPA
jgi:DNA repair protein RadC